MRRFPIRSFEGNAFQRVYFQPRRIFQKEDSEDARNRIQGYCSKRTIPIGKETLQGLLYPMGAVRNSICTKDTIPKENVPKEAMAEETVTKRLRIQRRLFPRKVVRRMLFQGDDFKETFPRRSFQAPDLQGYCCQEGYSTKTIRGLSSHHKNPQHSPPNHIPHPYAHTLPTAYTRAHRASGPVN